MEEPTKKVEEPAKKDTVNDKLEELKKKAARKILGETQSQSDTEDEIIDTEVTKKKTKKPKGKYDNMTMKELQTLAKERNVEKRSYLKKREDVIEKLEELDRTPQDKNEEEPKPKNKYQRMTIPELKKIMADMGITGRSTLKKKDDMIAKLLECESDPENLAANKPQRKRRRPIRRGNQ
jgi:hypothetical protein